MTLLPLQHKGSTLNGHAARVAEIQQAIDTTKRRKRPAGERFAERMAGYLRASGASATGASDVLVQVPLVQANEFPRLHQPNSLSAQQEHQAHQVQQVSQDAQDAAAAASESFDRTEGEPSQPSQASQPSAKLTRADRFGKLQQRLMADLQAGRESSLTVGEHILVGYYAEIGQPEWQSPFELVRAMKASAVCVKRGAKWTLGQVNKHLVQWWRNRKDADPNASDDEALDDAWDVYFHINAEDAATSFLSMWDKVKRPWGTEPITGALVLADAKPLSFGAESVSINTPGYRRFISMCGWLQVTNGEGTIVLPVKTLATAFDVRHQTISLWRKAAIADGYLRLARSHAWKAGVPNRSAEYRFDVGCCKMLRDEAHPEAQELFDALGDA